MNIRKWFTVGYILTLGISIGMILLSGVVVAPVIFNANEYLASDILTHYHSGILMTEIFVRLNYFLSFTALYVFLMEGYDYKIGKRDLASLAFTFLIISSTLLFVSYYTPFIVDAQSSGVEATKTVEFESIHKGSELDFMILFLSLSGLLLTKLGRGVKTVKSR